MRHGLLRALMAIAAGVVLFFAFPPYAIWPLALVGIALFSLSIHDSGFTRGTWLGVLCGLAFFLPLLHWSSTYVGALPWILLASSQAAGFGILGAALARMQRLPYWPVWAAAAWVAEEALRSRVPFGGFPWGRLAFSQQEGAFTALAAFGGAPLVTFAVALTGALLARFIQLTRQRNGGIKALLALAGIALVVLASLGSWLFISAGEDAPQTRIAVIQGNVPRLGLDFNAQREAVLANHVQQTLALADDVQQHRTPQPDLVIWPENASDIDPLTNADARARIDSAAKAMGVPILVGAILDGPGNKSRNAGVVWDPHTGPGATYVKRHPVPFGEYIPLRSIASKITDKVNLVRRELAPGQSPGTFTINNTKVADVICFEVAIDDVVRDAVQGGSQLLVVQTNNATFGRSAETHQQLAMARLRAVEHGMTTVVSATSGVSAIIRPDGEVAQRTKVFTADTMQMSVPVADRATVATRIGPWPEYAITAIAVLTLTATLTPHRRQHNSSGPSTVDDRSETAATAGRS